MSSNAKYYYVRTVLNGHIALEHNWETGQLHKVSDTNSLLNAI